MRGPPQSKILKPPLPTTDPYSQQLTLTLGDGDYPRLDNFCSDILFILSLIKINGRLTSPATNNISFQILKKLDQSVILDMVLLNILKRLLLSEHYMNFDNG